jgi:hypothetical protein
MKIWFDYGCDRVSIYVDNTNVKLWEILQCIEEQTKEVIKK